MNPIRIVVGRSGGFADSQGYSIRLECPDSRRVTRGSTLAEVARNDYNSNGSDGDVRSDPAESVGLRVRVPLIIHERLARWGRQLRPRVATWPVRVHETRSSSDLVVALGRSACPILIIDLTDRPRQGLEALERAMANSPNLLTLALESGSHPEVLSLARELGATHVVSGLATPPDVMAILARWLPLAIRRAESDGWAGDPEPEPEPWEVATRVRRTPSEDQTTTP